MRVLKFTGKAGPDVSAGEGIAPHFLHVRCRRLHSETENAAPAYPTLVQPACATFSVRHSLLTRLSP
jgi:hypothetical protein